MAEYLKLSTFAGPTKKLLLALIYLQELEQECWPAAWLNEAGDGGWFEGRKLEPHFCHFSHLHALGLAPKSKSSEFLVKPLNDLLNGSGFFDRLVLKPGKNGYLLWQFAIFPAALMTDMDIYALIESKDIALCTGDLDVALLTQIMLRYKMRFPSFSLLTADPKSNLLFDPNDTLIVNQRAFIAKLKRALKKWADLKRCRLVAELGQDGSAPGITSVIIRISHQETSWSADQLSKFHHRSIVIDVGSDISVTE